MYQGKPPIRTWRQMKRLLQAYNFALEEEEIENRPGPFMRYYSSNEIAEPDQQPSIKEQSTKGDSSLTDILATNTQCKPPIQESTEEEKTNFMPMCNQHEFFVEPKKVE